MSRSSASLPGGNRTVRASYPCHTYIRIEACPRIEACVEDPHDAIMMCWPLWHVAQPIRTAPNALHTIFCLPKVLLLRRSSLCKGCIQPGSMLGRCSDYTTPTCACGRTRHIVNTDLHNPTPLCRFQRAPALLHSVRQYPRKGRGPRPQCDVPCAPGGCLRRPVDGEWRN